MIIGELAHKKNFFKAVQEVLKENVKLEAAFDTINEKYFQINKEYKYKDFDSFKVMYYRFIEKEMKK